MKTASGGIAGSLSAQGLDGRPFVSFYEKENSLSFVWDGTQAREVEVSHGGYGEPVIATFSLLFDLSTTTTTAGLRMFAAECRLWASGWEARGRGSDGQP